LSLFEGVSLARKIRLQLERETSFRRYPHQLVNR